MPRIGLVTALLPPLIGGTQVLVWRLFQGDPDLVVVSGVKKSALTSNDGYSALQAPTLYVPYPHLRGYRLGLAPVLGACSAAWLGAALARVVRFLRLQRVDHVVSIPHYGPFALLGLLAARHLGIAHTLYILDAWEEASAGPIERVMVRLGLKLAARMPRSHLAVVSPALGAHYRKAFGFRDITWIPNPGPLSAERPTDAPDVKPFVLFTGGIKPFNIDAVRTVIRSVRLCRVIEKVIITGQSAGFAQVLRAHNELHDRVEFRLCSSAEVVSLQRQAAVLLVATNVDDTSQTALGYLPGRLPEYVSTGRPIFLLGPQDADATRAVRHWSVGQTSTTKDESEIAKVFDTLASEAMSSAPGRATPHQDLFLEVFSREEGRRRLLGEVTRPLSAAAANLAAEFERQA